MKFLPLLACTLLLASCTQAPSSSPSKQPMSKIEENQVYRDDGDNDAENDADDEAPTTTAKTPQTPSVTPDVSKPTNATYTLDDIAKHNDATSCWMAIDNKVYDVTSFTGDHPGGKAILKGCGKDATQMFSRHSEGAQMLKEKYKVGDLKS